MTYVACHTTIILVCYTTSSEKYLKKKYAGEWTAPDQLISKAFNVLVAYITVLVTQSILLKITNFLSQEKHQTSI